MIIVWGYRTKTTLVGYTEDSHKCFHCDTIGSQSLYKTVEQGHFFLIPVPIKRTKYCLQCSVRGCDGITEISKEQVDNMYITPA